MYKGYLLLLWDALACFDQGHDGVGEDWYPRNTAEVTSKFHSGFCDVGDVHFVKLG